MKYAITGHTQGIGRRLFQRLSPNILGFSRSTGYNINSREDRQKIIEQSHDCDIFINNASSEFGQTYLLIELALAWQHMPNKKIINVGSKMAEISILPANMMHLIGYQSEKLCLKNTVFKLKPLVQCQIEYRWFGYVGTEKILKRYPHFKPDDYITEDQAADIILS